jgi:hypothetical protein
MPAGSKPISRLDYTIKIVEVLGEEWLKEKNNTAGISGTKNKQTDSKHRPFQRRRARRVYIKYEKGLRGDSIPQHKCTE